MAKKHANLLAEKIWSTGWTYIRHVVDTAREPFLLLDENLKILTANESFYRTFDVHRKETEGQFVYDLGNGQWAGNKLRHLLDEIVPEETFFRDYEVDHDFPGVGRKIIILNARRVFDDSGDFPKIIILAMEDVTKQRDIEERLKKYALELENRVNQRTSELLKRVEQLEQVNKLIINRELKMVELKEELDELKKQLKSKK